MLKMNGHLQLVTIFLIFSLSLCNCQNRTSSSSSSSNETITSISPQTSQNVSVNPQQVINFTFSIPGARLLNAAKWIKSMAGKEETFIGRCLGAARRLKMIMPFLLFKLGVIVTTLAFLTIFSLKGLGIGVALLILNAGTIFSKFALLKHDFYHPREHYIPKPSLPVHLHIHKDPEHPHPHSHHHHHESYGPPPTTAWADRISQGLKSTKSIAERTELIKLYRRLGLDVDSVLNEAGDYADPRQYFAQNQNVVS